LGMEGGSSRAVESGGRPAITKSVWSERRSPSRMVIVQKITPAVSVSGCKFIGTGLMSRTVAVASGADRVGVLMSPVDSGPVELSWSNATGEGDGLGELSGNQANDVGAGFVGLSRLCAPGSSKIEAHREDPDHLVLAQSSPQKQGDRENPAL